MIKIITLVWIANVIFPNSDIVRFPQCKTFTTVQQAEEYAYENRCDEKIEKSDRYMVDCCCYTIDSVIVKVEVK